MSVLSGPEIVKLVHLTQREPSRVPGIVIDPFDPQMAGPNSYDVRLGDKLLMYDLQVPAGKQRPRELDMRRENPTKEFTIPESGWILEPGYLYLGHTVELVGCAGLVPQLETRSSVARLGISMHLSAGFGDDGGEMQWTLEITVVHPVRVFAGKRVAQIMFQELVGDRSPYQGRYQKQSGPVASRMHL